MAGMMYGFRDWNDTTLVMVIEDDGSRASLEVIGTTRTTLDATELRRLYDALGQYLA